MEFLAPFSPTMPVDLFIQVGIFYDSGPFIEYCRTIEIPDKIAEHQVPTNLNGITYGNRLDLSEINAENFLFLPLEILKGLTREQITRLPAGPVLRFSFMIQQELTRLNERDQKELKYEPELDEVKAGIKKLNHGQFGILDTVATRMHCSHTDVLNLSQQTVFMILKIDLDTAKYKKRLREIITHQPKPKR